uniref:F-box domain-containing protein n=2 Tax=Anas platyrhynchos TaxID=8839 RepID=A0A493TLH6_ANAPP
TSDRRDTSDRGNRGGTSDTSDTRDRSDTSDRDHTSNSGGITGRDPSTNRGASSASSDSSDSGDSGDLGTFPFSRLPPDCQLHVLSFLSPAEKCAAALVCGAWSRLVRSPRLWRVADFTGAPAALAEHQDDDNDTGVTAFARWQGWVRCYAFHLAARRAAPRLLRANFDLGDRRAGWAEFLQDFLESVRCGELRELELDWTLSPHQPPGPRPPGGAKLEQLSRFQALLELLSLKAPGLARAKLPFDWSRRSVAALGRFQHLHTLELRYFWGFRGVRPEALRELAAALPRLKTLVLHLLVPVQDLGTSYALESRSLEVLDVWRCRGLVFGRLELPALRALRVRKRTRGLILQRRARLALQSRWRCLYALLRAGAPGLRLLNNRALLPHWRERPYDELEAILRRACYCPRHADTWLL